MFGRRWTRASICFIIGGVTLLVMIGAGSGKSSIGLWSSLSDNSLESSKSSGSPPDSTNIYLRLVSPRSTCVPRQLEVLYGCTIVLFDFLTHFRYNCYKLIRYSIVLYYNLLIFEEISLN